MQTTQSAADVAKLGPVLATVLVAGNMIGSGVYLLPASLALIGGVSLMGWAIASAGALILAAVFSFLVRLRPHAEGMQDYASEGLGRFFGYQSGMAYWISDLAGDVAIAVAVTGALAILVPVLAAPLPALACTIAVLWVVTLLNILGPKTAARFGALTLGIGLLPILFVAVFGWIWFDPVLFARAWNVSGKPALEAAQTSLTLVFWAFTGLESATVAAAVVRQPERNVPVAAIGGVALSAVIYILASAVMFGLLPADELARSTAPFASAAGRALGAAALGLVAVCAFLKAAGTLGGWILVTAETTRSSAVLGFFPRTLARTRRDGTPVPALVLTVVLTTLAALASTSPTLGRQFAVLINVAVVLSMVVYAYCCIALARISREAGPGPARFWALGCGVAGTLFCIWVIATCEPQLLLVSAGLLAAAVPAWAVVRWLERRKAAPGGTNAPPEAI